MFYCDEYLQFLRARCAPSTVEHYRRLIGRFSRYCLDAGIGTVAGVKPSDVIRFLAPLLEKRPVTEGTERLVRRLVLYFRYLEETGRIFRSPFHDFIMPKAIKTHYPVLAEKELLSFADRIGFAGPFLLRGKAMIELAYSAALRPGEIRRLRIGDIDFENRTLLISQSKYGKSRFAPVGAAALSWIRRYIEEVRPRYYREVSGDCLFLSHKTGAPLTVYGVRWALQEAARKVGFPAFKPYSVRRSAATHLHNAGMGIAHIARLLGHEKISTTVAYLEIEMKKVKEITEARHPRNRMKLETKQTKGETE